MKKLLILLALLLPCFSYAGIVDHSTLTTGLLNYYLLDEQSGVRYDSHGSIDLSDINTVTYSTASWGDVALFTLANSEYLNTTSLWTTSHTNVSYAFWVKVNDYTAPMQTMVTNGKSYSAGWPRGGQAMEINPSPLTDGTIGVLDHNIAFHASTLKITDSNWHHLAFVFDSSGYVTIYLDYSSTWTDTSPVTGTPNYGSGIGAEYGVSRYFGGNISNLGIWSKALSASEVQDLYNSGTPLSYEATPTSTTSMCIYANIFDMNSVTGQTCVINGATTTCTYDTSPTTTVIQVTSGDLIFGIALIFFILVMLFIGFIMKPFKKL